MADISSYPQATPKGSDRVLGVQAYVEGDDSTAGNPTKTFTINDINNLVPGIDGDSLYIDTELTSAQILDLHNTPITIIPAQGAGTLVLIKSIYAKYTFGTTAYTKVSGGTGISITVSYTEFSAANPVTIQPLVINTASDGIGLQIAFGQVIHQDSNWDIFNAPMVLCNLPNNPITGGDGTIKIRTYYSVIPSTF